MEMSTGFLRGISLGIGRRDFGFLCCAFTPRRLEA